MKKQLLIDNIIKLFTKKNTALTTGAIAKALGIKAESANFPVLVDAILELTEQGILEKSKHKKYSLADTSQSEIIGVFRVKDDRGTVVTNLPHVPKINIKRRNMGTALNGDTVAVQIISQKKDTKFQGEVTRIVTREPHEIVGKIEYDGNFYFLVPNEADEYRADFLIPKHKLHEAEPGDRVIAAFMNWNEPTKAPQAEVVKIIGQYGNPTVEFDSVLREFNIIPDFPPKVIAQAKESAKFNVEDELPKRIDLRGKTIVTIDPKDAKDFDDALSLEIKPNGNYLLGVHIADVSYYVRAETDLDIEALKRGNSIYLTDRVIPMLPEELSNNMCSLMPDVERLAFTVMMEFDQDLELKNYEIAESVIKSARRFSYDEVAEILVQGEGDHAELLLKLHDLAVRLREKRFQGGGIDFKTSEVHFELDENKTPVRATLKTTTDATSLVEECMLIANKTVAEHIKLISPKFSDDLLPFIYRVHGEPLPEKIDNTIEFIKALAPKRNIEIKSSTDINSLLKIFDGTPEESIVNQLLVRSMPKAEYSDDNIGHYGLGFADYTHFTSPIRRYADLLVHRLLKEYARFDQAKGDEIQARRNRIKQLSHALTGIGEHCTDRERLAMEAERSSSKLAQVLLAKQYIGTCFNGTVTGVVEYGLFVTADEIFCEGLLHSRDMFDDYYIFDERNFRIFGKRKKFVFRYGSRLRVKIAGVNIEKRRIELEYISPNPLMEDEAEAGDNE